MPKGLHVVEERVAQGRSSLVPATLELIVGAVEVDLSRGVRAMVEFVPGKGAGPGFSFSGFAPGSDGCRAGEFLLR